MSVEDFEQKCEPSEVKITCDRYEKKVIGSSLYIVRVEVGTPWLMVCETKKTYEEFKVFH